MSDIIDLFVKFYLSYDLNVLGFTFNILTTPIAPNFCCRVFTPNLHISMLKTIYVQLGKLFVEAIEREKNKDTTAAAATTTNHVEETKHSLHV